MSQLTDPLLQVLLNAQASKLAPLPSAAKEQKEPKLPITPNYIKNPPVAYQVSEHTCTPAHPHTRTLALQVDLNDRPAVVEKKPRMEAAEVQQR